MIKIIDPELISQLNAQDEKEQQMQSPMQQQAVPQQQQAMPQQQQDSLGAGFWMNPPAYLAKGLLKNAAMGAVDFGANLNEAPYRIASALSEKGIVNPSTAESIHKWAHEFPGARKEAEKLLGAENPSTSGQITRSLTTGLPYMLSGINPMLSGAGYGLTQSETPFQSGALFSALGAIPAAASKMFPGRLSQKLVNASREKYTNLYRDVQGRYNNLFDEAGNNPLTDIRGRDLTRNKITGKVAEYLESDPSSEVHKLFAKNPIGRSGHELQSKIGGEIGDLQRKSYFTKLDRDEGKLLAKLVDVRNEVKRMVNKSLSSSGREYPKVYKTISDFYKSTVKPHEYVAKTLTKLGEEASPSRVWGAIDKLSRKGKPALTDIEYNPPVPREYLKMNETLKSKIGGQKMAGKIGKHVLKYALPIGVIEELIRNK